MDSTPQAKDERPVPEAFSELLRRLDADPRAAEAKYESLRLKLIKFLTWERLDFPEDAADEVLHRVATKILGHNTIENVERYTFGVARLVIKESWQQRRRAAATLANLRLQEVPANEAERHEQTVLALDACLSELSKENRDLIVRYYRGEKQVRMENRRELASELGIPVNALRNRALRVRDRLEQCVRKKLERE